MISKLYYTLFLKIVFSYHYRFRKNKNVLKEKLFKSNQKRWLDLGSSSRFDDDFYFADIHDKSKIPLEMQRNYFKIDITKPLSKEEVDYFGKFDLIRMQHVFEHFTFEDGAIVLENCNLLLKNNGYLLISVPDLKIFIKRYSRKCLNFNWTFTEWANKRIPRNAPQSFYFSIFTHSHLLQKHLWCYDKEGLIFQLERTGKFSNIKRIGLFNSLSNIPFTRNRPFEDLCLLAQKI